MLKGMTTLLELDVCKKIKRKFTYDTENPPIHFAIQCGQTECLKLLIQYDFEINAVSNNGCTPLHLAVELENIEYVEYLLSFDKILINARTDNIHPLFFYRQEEDTPLHIALKKGNYKIVKLLLLHGADPFISDAENCPAFELATPEQMKEYFDARIKNNIINYTFDFSSLLEQHQDYSGFWNCCAPNFLHTEMDRVMKLALSSKHRSLLTHPFIQYYLYIEWKKYWKVFISSILLYTSFTIFITLLIIYQTFYTTSEATGFEVPTIILIVILAIRELGEFLHSAKAYLSNRKNYLELSIIILSIIILVKRDPNISALLIVLTYFEFLLMISRHPIMETYINIFIRVSKNALSFIIWYLPVILSFSFAFQILMHESKDETFSSFWKTTIKTIIMLSGEYDASEFVIQNAMMQFIFISFLIFIVIIFMNLLNALAVGDTKSVRDEAEVTKYAARVWLLYQMEKASYGQFSNIIRNIQDFLCHFCKYCACFETKSAANNRQDGKMIITVPKYEKELKCSHSPGLHITDILQVNLSYNSIIKETRELLSRKNIMSTEERLEQMEASLMEICSMLPQMETLVEKGGEQCDKLENCEKILTAIKENGACQNSSTTEINTSIKLIYSSVGDMSKQIVNIENKVSQSQTDCGNILKRIDILQSKMEDFSAKIDEILTVVLSE